MAQKKYSHKAVEFGATGGSKLNTLSQIISEAAHGRGEHLHRLCRRKILQIGWSHLCRYCGVGIGRDDFKYDGFRL